MHQLTKLLNCSLTDLLRSDCLTCVIITLNNHVLLLVNFLDSCFERFARGIFRSVVSFLSTELARFAQQIGLDKTEVMDE